LPQLVLQSMWLLAPLPSPALAGPARLAAPQTVLLELLPPLPASMQALALVVLSPP